MEENLKESRKRTLRASTGKKSYRQRTESVSSSTGDENVENLTLVKRTRLASLSTANTTASRNSQKSESAVQESTASSSSSSSNRATALATDGIASPSPSSASSTSFSSSNRQLASLIDYFPNLEAPRRLTRSLTRKLRASVGGNLFGSGATSSPSSTTTGCGISSRGQVGVEADVAETPAGGSSRAKSSRKAPVAATSVVSMADKDQPARNDSTAPKEAPSANKSAHAANQQQLPFRIDNSSDRDFASSSSDSLDSSGRLHHLLESHRSIPIHIFGALGPRMQTFLSRCPSQTSGTPGASGGRWDSLLSAMQKYDDLSAQLQGLIELCNLLVMSNEETLGPGFPVKDVVRCLIRLLQTEHNFDIMTHACRALTYLMEALPRVTVHVTDAVPFLLEKLQRVECIDVAEQALAALELLSRRHGKNILSAGGISACLQYIDFFSMSSQRSSLQIVANCCLHMTNEDFPFVSDSLSSLSQRLTSQDKKTVELMCSIFTRLVENYLQEWEKLRSLCDFGLLENIQQMIVTSPPILNSATLCSVIRMLHLLCRQCSELAVRLLRLNVVAALRLLLLGTVDPNATGVELLARTPQELYELVLLIGELWPPLPNDGIFEVDGWLKPSSPNNEHILWTWKDDKGLWRPFMHVDNRILEAAFQSKEEEISLSTLGQTFTVDLVNMIQVNEETGHSQPIQRRVASSGSPSSKKPSGKQACAAPSGGGTDPRLELLRQEGKLFTEFVHSLFPVLYEIYTSVGGPAVRHECLRSLLRMIYHSDADLLKDVLKKHSISSLVAGMLNSQDLKTVVPALQLARVLIEKQPEIFTVHFKREGVTHQLHKLSVGSIQLASSTMPTTSVVSSSSYLAMASSRAAAAAALGAVDASLPYYAPAHGVAAAVISNATTAALTSTSGASYAVLNISSSPTYAGGGAVPKRTATAAESSSTAATSNRVSATASSSKKRGSIGSPSSAVATAAGGGKHSAYYGGSERLRPVLRSRGRASSAEASSMDAAGKSWNNNNNNSNNNNNNSGSSTETSGGRANATPGAAHGTSSLGGGLLANLSLPRWVRPGAFARQTSAPAKPPPPPPSSVQSVAHVSSHHSLAANNFLANKTVSWVKEQAKTIIGKHFASTDGNNAFDEDAVLKKMTEISSSLRKGEVKYLDDLAAIFLTDVSCFEILQSDLIGSLTDFLTADSLPSNVSRAERIRRLCESFFAIRVTVDSDGVPSLIFESVDNSVAKRLVQKLNSCVSQLEQLPVKAHDFGWGQSGSALRGLNALRFLHTQQIKCLLQRHPEEKSLRQWRKGPIKVDPLAQVSTIERYLITRGYGRPKSSSNEEVCSEEEEDTSGDDSDDATVRQGFSNDQADGQHRLQLTINDKVLPYELTIYQAVRQFGSRSAVSFSDSVGSPDWLGPEIWVNTHTLCYRLINDKLSADCVNDKLKLQSGKNRAKDKAHLKPVLDPKEIEVKPPTDPLVPYLQNKLNTEISDPSFECINLLRILFGLSRYWWSNFKDAIAPHYEPILSVTEFHNAKVSGKIARQLQDPLTLIAGQLPSWVEHLALSCPFLCPFEVRTAMFHVLALDRDRALQRLLDNFFDSSHSSGSERATPRLERRKVIVNRDDILRQAETVLGNTENNRAVLEVQYENEVGTGLGPTLEFYALVSKQLQKANLQLWRGDIAPRKDGDTDDGSEEFIASNRGLYPLALGRHTKQGQLDKMKTKFKTIGKLLGRALLDGRILDLPLSPVLYKWLLKDESTLHLADLYDLDGQLFKSLQFLRGQLLKSQLGEAERLAAKRSVESLDLDFTFPGNSTVELTKGGKDTLVTLDNLELYVDLVLHWLLRAGVQRQMETLRDSFDSVLSLKRLKLFLPEEMDQLFCGARSDAEPWDPAMLRQAIHPDHGYTHDSPQILWLVQILSGYDEAYRRLFLQFITGSPRLPVGGLKNLNPPLTAVRKHDGGNPDTHLPSVMTCVNYLKLPEYSNRDVMAQRLSTAVTCGCFSFHLS